MPSKKQNTVPLSPRRELQRSGHNGLFGMAHPPSNCKCVCGRATPPYT